MPVTVGLVCLSRGKGTTGYSGVLFSKVVYLHICVCVYIQLSFGTKIKCLGSPRIVSNFL